MGRGMGGDSGQGRGIATSSARAPQRMGSSIQSKDQKLEDLKQQAGRLNEKMKEVISRIHNIEKR